MTTQGDLLHVVTNDNLSPGRMALGRVIIWGSGAVLVLVAAAQALQAAGIGDFGFANWRPTLYAYVFWAICLCWGQVLTRESRASTCCLCCLRCCSCCRWRSCR